MRPEWRDSATPLANAPAAAQLQAALERPDSAGPEHWRDWPRKFDYLYLMLTDPGDASPAPRQLEPLVAGSRFQLYRIRHAAP